MHVSVRVRVPDPQDELQSDQLDHRAHFDQTTNDGKSSFPLKQITVPRDEHIQGTMYTMITHWCILILHNKKNILTKTCI